MKRYISAILVPCLLLQFLGCSSKDAITLEELKHFEGDNEIILTTTQGEIVIKRSNEDHKSMNWIAKDSSIYLEIIESVPVSNNENIRTQNKTDKEISYNDIELIQVKSANVLGTIGLTIAILVVLDILAWGISTGFEFDFDVM
jgi:hypothetical protein